MEPTPWQPGAPAPAFLPRTTPKQARKPEAFARKLREVLET
jgi:hypothetical protein